ncbi:MAG: hypothetical protein QNJ97_05210 [Myxococcota bacterium]|nr:hypothetical protein [Myxococcota bacterium]
MSEVTSAVLRVLEDLIRDRWRSSENRADDFLTSEGQVNLVEVFERALAAYTDFPRLLNLEPEAPDWWMRNGNGLELHLETNDVSTLALPGFILEITDQQEINFLVPTFSQGSRAIDIVDINLRPAEGVGSITLDWEDGPPSLVMRIAFESEGQEITGFRDIDWDRMEIAIRMQPYIDSGRLFWSSSVDVEFSPTPSRYSEKLISQGIQDFIRSLLTALLNEWVTEIAAYLFVLPLKPVPDSNGSVVLSELDPINFLTLIGQQGIDLPDEWGDFTENFVNACLLPNNPLRAIALDGLDYQFWPARLVDHYALHTSAPTYDVDSDSGEGKLVFYDEPIQVPSQPMRPYHGPEYISRIVRREKYRITLDHVQLLRQVFDQYHEVPGESRWSIAWTIAVRHPNLAWPSWVTLSSKEVSINTYSPIFDLAQGGLSIDWLEVGGDIEIAGEVKTRGRPIASFRMEHRILEEVPVDTCLGLEHVTSTITARARLERLTTIDQREVTWLKLIMRHLYFQIDRDFLYQYLGHPPLVEADRWLTEQILSRIHVAVYINDDLLSLTSASNLRVRPSIGLRTGHGYAFPEAHATFHIHHRATDADASFTVRVCLCVLETDNSFTQAAVVERDIMRHDPHYPESEWRIPFGESSTRLLLGDEADPMRVSMGLQNEQFNAGDLPIEYRPKPYQITISNVHANRDYSIGKGDIDFWYRIWSETNGQPSDHQHEGKLGFVEADAPFDWTPPAYAFPWEAPVGSTIHIHLRGRDYNPVRVYSMGNEDASFEISPGDRQDREHTSSSGDFNFRALVQTATPPLVPTFQVHGAGADRQLEILPTESWSFDYGVSWADTIELVYSSDPDLAHEDWAPLKTLYRETETETETEGELVGASTFDPPEGSGQRAGFYCLRACNSAGITCSAVLELRVP